MTNFYTELHRLRKEAIAYIAQSLPEKGLNVSEFTETLQSKMPQRPEFGFYDLLGYYDGDVKLTKIQRNEKGEVIAYGEKAEDCDSDEDGEMDIRELKAEEVTSIADYLSSYIEFTKE